MNHRKLFLLTALLVASESFAALASTSSTPAIVPLPEKITVGEGHFLIQAEAKSRQTRILADPVAKETADYLVRGLRQSTGYRLPVTVMRGSAPRIKNDIVLTTDGAATSLGAEGYELRVTQENVIIRAPTSAGLFYGVQTLLQLLPPEVFSKQPVHGKDWEIPCVQIEDKPRFKWRGLMLDVARHFFTTHEVEQVLDAMALHKLNTFHWHLVDDQGWRIEIKKYPKLTQVSAWRQDIGFDLDPKASTAYGPDGRYGGFYTQADIREVVRYAKSLHITIVPEIEMPGHSGAALTAYPEFSCNGGKDGAYQRGGGLNGVYCVGNEKTFTFVKDVLKEVGELFPGKYIHIGGDEVMTSNWRECPQCQERMQKENLAEPQQLESYFIRRVEKYLNAEGRTLIGWSEITQGGLAQNAVVMDWIGGGREATRQGHDVVMSPQRYCYLDHYQSKDKANEPRAIGGYLPLMQVYSFEPIPANLDPQYASHILGAQGNCWTEYMPSLKHVEYMIFPRLCALSEVVWSPKDSRDWNSFTQRLTTDMRRLDELGVNYRHGFGEVKEAQRGQIKRTTFTAPAQ